MKESLASVFFSQTVTLASQKPQDSEGQVDSTWDPKRAPVAVAEADHEKACEEKPWLTGDGGQSGKVQR